MKKKSKIIFRASIAVTVVVLILWSVMFINTNKKENKIYTAEEYYKTGDTVELAGNFHVSKKTEATDGYSIRVNGAELMTGDELKERYGTLHYNAPDLCILLNITVTNNNNEDGALFLQNYGLFNGAMKLDVDFTLWADVDPHYDGWPFLKIIPNTSADITIPFIPNGVMDELGDKTVKRMEKGHFYFNATDYPVRKMIEVNI